MKPSPVTIVLNVNTDADLYQTNNMHVYELCYDHDQPVGWQCWFMEEEYLLDWIGRLGWPISDVRRHGPVCTVFLKEE